MLNKCLLAERTKYDEAQAWRNDEAWGRGGAGGDKGGEKPVVEDLVGCGKGCGMYANWPCKKLSGILSRGIKWFLRLSLHFEGSFWRLRECLEQRCLNRMANCPSQQGDVSDAGRGDKCLQI